LKSKIVIIVPEISEFGGAKTYFFHLLSYYEKYPDLRIIVCFERQMFDAEIKDFIIKNGIKKVIIPKRPIVFRNLFRKFPFSIVYDLVILIPLLVRYNPELLAFSIINPGNFLGSFLFRKKILYVIHSDINNSGKYLPKIPTFLAKFSDGKKQFLVVSNYLRERLLHYWAASKKNINCNTIYNKPSNNNQIPELIEHEKKLSIVILTVGHLEAHKNPEIWLKVAVKTLQVCSNHTKFIWLGSGSFYKKIEQQIPGKYRNQIILKGYCKQVDSYYKTADIYFTPSINETFGIGVIDAMKYSIPSVVSEVGGLPELITEGENGFLLDKNDITGFSEKLKVLIDNRELRMIMGRNGHRKYKRIFSPEIWEKKMDLLHGSIIYGVDSSKSFD
jgi:glycosyltransferase involved in cell wall biosynthesis